jgi:DNA helicase-2/ATP-dependent DNA helicase PcrA
MASQTPGATTVEAVDLVDLTDFGAAFNLDAADALTRLVQFAAGVMTQVGPAALLPRLETLRRGRARNRRRLPKQR